MAENRKSGSHETCSSKIASFCRVWPTGCMSRAPKGLMARATLDRKPGSSADVSGVDFVAARQERRKGALTLG